MAKKFKEVREEWWTGVTIGKRETTNYRKSEIIRCHVSPFFDDKDIDKITDIDINNYIIHELECGNRITHKAICQNSVIKALNLINNILEYAKAKKYIQDNPIDLAAKLKKAPTKEYTIYTPDQVRRLIEVARPKWLGDMILLAYNTGMRKEEIYGLQWADVNLEQKVLFVNRTIVAISPHTYFINDPKTERSRRGILLDDETIKMLERKKEKSNSEWVFANQYGKEMNPWYHLKYFGKARKKEGITGRFHDLRHTHITELVEANVPLPVIQKRVGHSDIRMTMRYTHIDNNMQQAAVDFINNRK